MPAVNEYKCRNCGASLSLSAAENGVLHCEYCHSSFTVPKKETSPAALDFIRTGEHELDTCSFYRAYAAYQKAAESDKNEPEAYFGMELSEFKVRYIRDVKNNCLQAICYDVSDKSFRRDQNYRKAKKSARGWAWTTRL